METYHKISTPFKRHKTGPLTDKLILNDWALPEFEYLQNNQWEFTEKVDGTNIRVELVRVEDTIFVEYGGRTNNAVINTRLRGHLESTFPTFPSYRRDLSRPAYRDRYEQIGSWMVEADLEKVMLFGEGYGPGIHGGGKYRDDYSFVLFDVKIGDWWLNRKDVEDVAIKLGIEFVPVIGYGTLWDAIKMVEKGTRDIHIAEGYTITQNRGEGLKSQWGDFEAEGIVARPVVPLFTRRGDRIITKIKGKDFA